MNNKIFNHSYPWFIIIVIFQLAAFSIPLKAQDYLWAKSIGATGSDVGQSIVVDKWGNVYITGSYSSTVDFDPGAGTANLTANGFSDIFFAKYDSNGNYLWAKSMGSPAIDYATKIAIDKNGNLFIIGDFKDSIDFDPGAGNFILGSQGDRDVYFAKYDSNGIYLWAKSIGNSSEDVVTAIALDDTGNVYITGYYQNTLDFDPDTGISNLTSAGGIDIYLAKYDASGNYVWANSMGGNLDDYSRNNIIDNSGNIYVVGLFQDTADFDPGASIVNLVSKGAYDLFLAKYDKYGNYSWAKSAGNPFNAVSYTVVVDKSLNVFISGTFRDTVDFDFGAGTANLSAVGLADLFIAKYDSAGNFIWANSAGKSQVYPLDMAIDNSSNLYLTGRFYDAVDFDPGPATTYLTSKGINDIFFAKYDSAGYYLGGGSMGGIITDYGTGIATDKSENIYFTGSFESWTTPIDFDIGPGTSIINWNGGRDIFIAKYDCGTTFNQSVLTICNDDSAFIYGIYQDTTGTYYDSLINNEGCDSVLTTQLGVNQVPTVSFTGLDTLYCQFVPTDSLTGIPPSGIFTGPGITGNTFTPFTAGIGTHTITYTYTDSNNCFNSYSETTEVQLCVGTNELDFNAEISIYPNPNAGYFSLKISLLETQDIQVKIINCLGQKVHNETLIDGQGLMLKRFDLRHLPPGMYFIEIRSGEVSRHKKVILK